MHIPVPSTLLTLSSYPLTPQIIDGPTLGTCSTITPLVSTSAIMIHIKVADVLLVVSSWIIVNFLVLFIFNLYNLVFILRWYSLMAVDKLVLLSLLLLWRCSTTYIIMLSTYNIPVIRDSQFDYLQRRSYPRLSNDLCHFLIQERSKHEVMVFEDSNSEQGRHYHETWCQVYPL